jgi:hypothetical protein
MRAFASLRAAVPDRRGRRPATGSSPRPFTHCATERNGGDAMYIGGGVILLIIVILLLIYLL